MTTEATIALVAILIVSGAMFLALRLIRRHPTIRGAMPRPPAGFEEALEPPAPGMHPDCGMTPRLDENVQFTVYRPKVIQPQRWYPLLAFAHLAERRPDAGEDQPDPIEEVERQAAQILGGSVAEFRQTTQDSSQAIPRQGEMMLLPEVPGIEFNPPSRCFLWEEAVHREEFRLRAAEGLDGQTARGRLTVFLGSILLAEVSLSFRVEELSRPEAEGSHATDHARPYRKIFASYSHKDVAIVNQFEWFARVFGDEYLRDWTHLRAGEVWTESLERMIRGADVFQLFWSRHSMDSPFVRQEWEYALSLRRPYFIRPTYWEEPLPCDPERGLPPEELRRLHFQRLNSVVIGPGPSLPALPDTALEPHSDAAAHEVEAPARSSDAMASEIGPGPSSTDTPAAGPSFFDDPIVTDRLCIGRFEDLRLLSEGGMSQVWHVRSQFTADRVLKFIRLHYPILENARSRFDHEARIWLRFGHPNIVAVHDAGLAGDMAFIEMEYIRGQGLDKLMGRGEPMPLDWIGRILNQLCDALQAAHEHGVVHRDLKPSNLMLVDGWPPGEEFLKILDFGLAKLLSYDTQGPDGRPLTVGFLGTVQYASPEQLMGQPVDGRSDLYATGVMLYEMLTGFRPFGGTAMEQMHAHVHQDPPPMRLTIHVPPEVETVVMRCLAKQPSQRPQSPRELAEEFQRAINLYQSHRTVSPSRRRWQAFAVAAGVMALLTAILAVAHFYQPPRTPVAVPPEIDVELKSNKPDNVFAPGDRLVITATNHSGRDLFLELIGTDARGKMAILAPSTTVIPAGQSFRYPPKSEDALLIQPGLGREQITAFVSDAPFPTGEIVHGQDGADRIVHPFDELHRAGERAVPPIDPSRVVKKTITIETR